MSDSTRKEEDEFGTASMPADSFVGSGTVRAVASLSFSRRTLASYPELRTAMAAVKAAAARTNAATGVHGREIADAVVQAARHLAAGAFDDDLVADPFAGGGAISVNVNVNEVLANAANSTLGAPLGTHAPVHPKATVNASQSTADVVHTAARLAVLDRAESLGAAVGRAVDTLRRVAARASGIDTLGRTCLQDALAVPAALLWEGSAKAVERAGRSLAVTLEPLEAVVLGGTVVGTGEGASVEYRESVVPTLAGATGRPLRRDTDPASRLQHVDDLLAVIDAVHRLAGTIAKVARDVRLLASGPNGGLGEIDIPAVMEGSTFFVGKVNPAVAETMIQAAARVTGHTAAAHASAREGELHLHGHDLAVAVTTLDALVQLEGALHHFVEDCLAGIEFDEDRCRELAAFARSAPSTTTGDDT